MSTAELRQLIKKSNILLNTMIAAGEIDASDRTDLLCVIVSTALSRESIAV